MHAAKHVLHFRPGFERLGRLRRLQEGVGTLCFSGDKVASEKGGHEIGAVLLVELRRFGVGVGAVFNGVAASFQERVDAVDTVGVGRHLAAHRVGGLDDGAKLSVGELLAEACGGVGENAAGGGDLDDVGPVANAFSDRPRAIIGA